MDAGRSDFYDYPDLYDALLPVGAEVPFYVDLARQQAGAVLELACGTGQLTIPIALQGLPTVGLDQSRAMLDAAKRRASAVSASVAFLQGDMRDFAFGREFNLDHFGILSLFAQSVNPMSVTFSALMLAMASRSAMSAPRFARAGLPAS